MNTKDILKSKKTEKVLWILIIGTFILSILLGKYVLEPQKATTVDQEDQQAEVTPETLNDDLVELQALVKEARESSEPVVEEAEPVEVTEVDSFVASIENYNRRSINVGGQQLEVAVAETSAAQVLGLSNTKSFPAAVDGLLFAYEPGSFPSIWMKDMNYNIDILWLDGDYNVVHRENNVSPDTFPESFRSPEPSQYVLETVPGKIDS